MCAEERKGGNDRKSHSEEETKRVFPKIEDSTPVPLDKLWDKTAQHKPENIIYMIATDGELVLLEELLQDTNVKTVSPSNETLLYAAAKHGHLSVT